MLNMHQCAQDPHSSPAAPDDRALLKAFADNGSEPAFQSLVEQYLGMVLGIARRRLGDDGVAAEEIAQSVFMILARKAHRLKPEGSLAPWIHRVTMIECAEAMRREAKHRTRMRVVSAQLLGDCHGREIWRDALPILDEAIDALSKNERAVVMLRFFERKSFRDIGVALGKSEDAAQKQCERVLQRLSIFLGKRGVRVSVALLASGLAIAFTEASAHAAVAGISHRALQAASAFDAKLSILEALETMTRTKLSTGLIVGVALGVPLIMQWGENRGLREQLHAASKINAPGETARGVVLPPAAVDPRISQNLRVENVAARTELNNDARNFAPTEHRDRDSVADWKQALFLGDPLARSQRLAELMSRLTSEDAPAVAAAFEQVGAAGIKFSDEQRLFLRAWGKIAGGAAVEYALKQSGENSEEAVAALGGWASHDPVPARAWLEALPESEAKETLTLGLLDGWSATNFDAAAAYAESRPPSAARDRFRELLVQRALRSRGIDGARQWVQRIPEDERNRDYKQHACADVVQAMLYRDPAAAAGWIAELGAREFVGAEAVTNTALKLAESSPTGALEWMRSLNVADAKGVAKGAGTVMGQWAQADAATAGVWLQQNSSHPFYERLALGYIRTVAGIDREGARAWADTIRDEELRGKAMAALEPQTQNQFLVAFTNAAGTSKTGARLELLGESVLSVDRVQKHPHPAGPQFQNCAQCHPQ
jgi:RNA polymerase sigma factor (sigma-70 family)